MIEILEYIDIISGLPLNVLLILFIFFQAKKHNELLNKFIDKK